MIRVLIADDQQLVRAGLRMLCEATADIEVVGEAHTGAEAIRLTHEHAPNVVLMDLRMPGTDGIAATSRIVAERPATRVVVLTTFDDDDHLYPALEAGAHGFLGKDAAATELVDAVRRAARGENPFGQAVLTRLVAQAVRARGGPAAADDFTDRERDVLTLLAAGMSNAEIAHRLHLGVTTVKSHVASLMTKTGSTNRVHLAVHAVRTGVVPG